MDAGSNAASIAAVAWHLASGYVTRWCLVEHDPPTARTLGWPKLVLDAFLKPVTCPPVLVYLRGNVTPSADSMPHKQEPLQTRKMQQAEIA